MTSLVDVNNFVGKLVTAHRLHDDVLIGHVVSIVSSGVLIVSGDSQENTDFIPWYNIRTLRFTDSLVGEDGGTNIEATGHILARSTTEPADLT